MLNYLYQHTYQYLTVTNKSFQKKFCVSYTKNRKRIKLKLHWCLLLKEDTCFYAFETRQDTHVFSSLCSSQTCTFSNFSLSFQTFIYGRRGGGGGLLWSKKLKSNFQPKFHLWGFSSAESKVKFKYNFQPKFHWPDIPKVRFWLNLDNFFFRRSPPPYTEHQGVLEDFEHFSSPSDFATQSQVLPVFASQ